MPPKPALLVVPMFASTMLACAPTGVVGEESDSEETMEQECPELLYEEGKTLLLETEEEVLALPLYTRFEGRLTLLDVPGITDLAALHCLREVNGSLSISSPDLESLDGLERLEIVSSGSSGFPGRLTVSESPKLVSVSGLSSLRQVDELEISENSLLESLEPLSSLESAEEIEIWGNDSLATLGLRNLAIVEDFYIGTPYCYHIDPEVYPSIGNAGLTEIDGLDSLATFNNLGIFGNPNLVAIDGLVQLADSDGWMGISLAFNESLAYNHIIEVQSELGFDFETICNNLDDPEMCTCSP
jgi:hypothetical protein